MNPQYIQQMGGQYNPQYAKETEVTIEKSKMEIEVICRRYGASGFMTGWNGAQAMLAFEMNGKHIRFILPLPDKKEQRFTHYKRVHSWIERSPASALTEWEQACRQRFRALKICIQAKLEAVACGIVTFEAEFMPHMVMSDGRTVAEHVLPQIEGKKFPRLNFNSTPSQTIEGEIV